MSRDRKILDKMGVVDKLSAHYRLGKLITLEVVIANEDAIENIVSSLRDGKSLGGLDVISLSFAGVEELKGVRDANVNAAMEDLAQALKGDPKKPRELELGKRDLDGFQKAYEADIDGQ